MIIIEIRFYLKTWLKVINPLLVELWQLEEEKSVCFVVIISCQLVTSFGLLHLDDVAPGSF